MSALGDKSSARLPWAIAGFIAYGVVVAALNLPFEEALPLAVGAWWCIVVIADDAAVFKTVPILAKLRSLFNGNGWQPLASVLVVGLLLSAPALLAPHNRFSKPFISLGAPAVLLGAFGMMDNIWKWGGNIIHRVRHFFGLQTEMLREALRPAIVKVALSELDVLQTEIKPRIEDFMSAEAVRMKRGYAVKAFLTSALSSEEESMERHRRAAYNASKATILSNKGKEVRIAVGSRKSITVALVEIMRNEHREATLRAPYPTDTFYGIIEPTTRTAFFSILNDMLTERGGQRAEQAAIELADLSAAVNERGATARATG